MPDVRDPRVLGTLRMAYHEEVSASRDARFQGWNAKRVIAWNNELEAYLATGDGDLADIVARRWRPCPTCHRHFQPQGPRGTYASCFSCNQVARMDGAALCVICQRTHGTAYPCCKFCETAGREDMAAFLRSLVLRRGHFRCALCDTEEGSMQVKHINPEGSAWQWNLEICCSSCAIMKAKSYGPLDELAWLDMAMAYSTYLADYLDGNETEQLRVQLKENLGGDLTACPAKDPYGMGHCDEIEGMLTAAHLFNPTEVTHV